MIELFAAGIWELVQPQVLIILFLACIVGLVIGALPGLNATMAVAIILPLTFSFNETVEKRFSEIATPTPLIKFCLANI